MCQSGLLTLPQSATTESEHDTSISAWIPVLTRTNFPLRTCFSGWQGIKMWQTPRPLSLGVYYSSSKWTYNGLILRTNTTIPYQMEAMINEHWRFWFASFFQANGPEERRNYELFNWSEPFVQNGEWNQETHKLGKQCATTFTWASETYNSK